VRVAGKRVGKRLGTHQDSIWVLGWGRRGCRRGGPLLPTAAAAGALAPARRLPGGLREQDGEQQQVQERVEGTTVGARGRWNSGSPRRSSLAPAGGSGRGGRASGHRPRRGGGGSLARRRSAARRRPAATVPMCPALNASNSEKLHRSAPSGE
jgi:hypothetical protein